MNYQQNGFNINPFINKANQLLGTNELYQNFRQEIFQTVNEEALNHFNRTQLFEYWQENDKSIGSKIILTNWWGGISHNNKAPKFYSEANFILLNNINNEVFFNTENLYHYFENLNLRGIGISYFTKYLQFSNCQINNYNYLIADKWSTKATIAYLIAHNNIHTLDLIFRNNYNDPAFRRLNGSTFQSYLAFLDVFNNIVQELNMGIPENQPNLNSHQVEGLLFGWGRDLNNPINPRFTINEIIDNYLNQ